MKPRVLIVGTVPYNEKSTSRAFHSYFCNWERESLAQVFSHTKKPAKGHCATLCQITDERLIRRRFDRTIKTGIVYDYSELPDRWGDVSLEVNSSLFSALYRLGARKSALTHLIRSFVWKKEYWCTDEFNAWLDRFNPQCVFLSFSDDYFIPEIAMYAADRFNIPILSSIGDDYYFNADRTMSLFYPIYKSAYRKLLREVFAHRGTAIYVSDKIRDRYNCEFELDGETVYLTSNAKRRAFRPIDEANPRIAYFGNIRCGRYRSLNEIGNALGAIDRSYILRVYSDETDPKYCGAFDGNPNVQFCGSIPYRDVLEKIHESDIVLVVEGFTRRDIEKTRYSLSTKVADLLASGVAILTYGSIECGAVEYMNETGGSAVCGSKDELRACIARLIRDREYQRRLYDNAVRITDQNHSLARSAQIFEGIVERLVHTQEPLLCSRD